MEKRIFTAVERHILKRNRLSKIDFTVRVFTVLRHRSINTLGELLQCSEKDLSSGYLGSKRVSVEIHDELSKIGLSLRND